MAYCSFLGHEIRLGENKIQNNERKLKLFFFQWSSFPENLKY